MGPATHSLATYRELADWYERLGQTTMRDRFLMLAADVARQAGLADEAERLRLRLLSGSRHHMLRPYASWAEASAAADVQAYLRDLRLNYPPEVAEQLLASLKHGSGAMDQTPSPSPSRGAAPIPYAAPMSAPIPYTAPMMDVNGPAPAIPRTRLARPLDEPYPLADDVGKTAALPQAAAARPRQAAARPAPPPEEKRPQGKPRNGARWINVALGGLMSLAALAVAALALARPFVPEAWLR